MKKQKTFRNVKFHHEDTGFCRDTFYCDDFPGGRRYYNRSTVSGAWYTTYPSNGYYEDDALVKPEVVFNILDKNGNVAFVEGNETEPTFMPFDCYISKKTMFEFCKKHNLKDIDFWQFVMVSTPEYKGYKGYKDNWLYSRDFRKVVEAKTAVEKFSYLGYEFIIYKEKIVHTGCNKEYTEYSVQSEEKSPFYCDWTIGYEV